VVLGWLAVQACSTGAADPSGPAPAGVAFQPRGFREIPSVQYPSRAGVSSDLARLESAGFRSLVTYGAADILGLVPALARAAGFDGRIVMGIWDPLSEEELASALAQAPHVDGYCVGNEGLGVRYEPDQLGDIMSRLRRATGKPVTTSEPIDHYLRGPYRSFLHEHSDWLFPNAHPYLAGLRDAVGAVSWTVARYDYLTVIARGKEVLLKEAGYPTHREDCCGERDQLMFFQRLHQSGVGFFMFEAFDQPGKRDLPSEPGLEQHWGVFRADGTPKAAALWVKDGSHGRVP
jgi:exo-beta-1,3-glucanase (GH17 family)